MAAKTVGQIMTMMPEGWESFLIVFARFECILKEFDAFRRPMGVADSPSVLPDWGAFGKFLGEEFFEDVKAKALAPTLIGHPPWHQEIVSGHLHWRESGNVDSVSTLFGAITMARNNLAHGGKFNELMSMIGLPRTYAENMAARDAALLSEAKMVLLHALNFRKCEDIRARFFALD